MLLEHEQNHGLGMRARVTVCSWNTNRTMVWAWVLGSPYARGTRTKPWFGHACSGHRMRLEHEQNHGLGMRARVTVCSWNTNRTMVWAWVLGSPYARGTRTEPWFGHACSCHRMLLEHEQNHGLGMGARVTVCFRNTNRTMIWAWVLWSPYALGTRTEPWFGHACSCHRMLLEHEQNHGLGMRARVTVCSWNTNRTMVWACVLGSPYALGTRTEPWFGHACSGHRMHVEHEQNHGLGMGARVTVCSWNTNRTMVWACVLLSPYALGTRTEPWFGHGCSGHRMLLEHGQNHGLGMRARVTVCSWNTTRTMVWACVLGSPYALGTRTEPWFGHACSGHRMLLEHEQNHGLGMRARVTA